MDYKAEKLELLLKNSVYKEVSKFITPFACLVSGGLDSGLLAALSEPDVVYSVNFPYGERYDESPYREAVIKHLKLNYKLVEFTKDDVEPYLKMGVKALGKAVPHFSLAPLTKVFEAIKNAGIKNVLSGEGPDELLGGYARYLIMLHEEELFNVEELRNYHPMLEKYLGNTLERYARLTGRKLMDIESYWDKYPHLLSRLGYIDLETDFIEEMEQGLAKYFGLNLVYPFLDEELKEFCFGLPDEYKVRNYTSKWLLRQVCKKYLPKVIVERKSKMGGPVAPINIWMGWDKTDGEFGKKSYMEYQQSLL